jgi:hypothetical protein
MREHGAVEAFVPSPEDEGILAALLQPPPEQPQVGEREEGSDVQL